MRKEGMRQNKVILLLLAFYLVILVFISVIACLFAYRQKQGEILSDIDLALLQVATEYRDITENFTAVYLPIFENKSRNDSNYSVLQGYFAQQPAEALTPPERLGLREVLAQMAVRDKNVQWIAAISEMRDTNYIYFPEIENLSELDETFPYWEQIAEKSQQMEIYGIAEVEAPGGVEYRCIAISGGFPIGMGPGTIVVGFSTNRLEQISKSSMDFTTHQFDIVTKDISIYTSGEMPIVEGAVLEKGQSEILSVADRRMYFQAASEVPRSSSVYYSVEWRELFLKSHANTPGILVIVFALAGISAILYFLILRLINKEVNIIRSGLEKLGKNQLDTRIEANFQQGGFEAIAESINAMAGSLKENIDRAYYYELKQRDSELQELQAKFNPHFLYNSLELIRSRCDQNGDEETAELVSQTASIFRGFIGSRTFIPMEEELAFTKRYLALFRARYGERVRILYDVYPEVLQYGIIRNVFQPLIENYFVHGISAEQEDNVLLFRGEIRDEDTILITVEDNGVGISEEALLELNKRLHEPVTMEEESYGLKNLHQRLRLFYGDGCGLTIRSNNDRGFVAEMVIKRLEYNESE